ncbi:MAG: hypothetical protein A2268_09635 [Candidatus Raymondbacteria bacterium RifOxyA12_full_50_37]|uniref:Uncharacterized protein n=1 Tax=Candidatus Raymondbacteria bacterium RIFOXYD12_FULL_49_13 TaxID=1817890 RepID=A0A1F7F1C4_UNCRA|nr:MAG: hypothetical protein A2268_09635 [Candidatus Raymondbacteria bacterium RifOxyA12_full_50_37]OGJ93149.1 MAG: hypothetical protein A2350_17830 [Candidatus Raymondbacteria bacterium RifOxyB12_full_50_8]OGJ93899.1 MAG: hypothetical protein A2248_06660 [Candidatus Raymondbacteria bacterium RIFOXYA2_FULL_49_16]OGJ98232.1 MAG: hypothetical protein A2453_00505 [Candidatus Raymondbacteria bacterium RIFOXYC2_FULL_50_21]OGK00465.1 MAG: hypothetical protein A2519_10680 [Candidatus Raymondbacteria b
MAEAQFNLSKLQLQKSILQRVAETDFSKFDSNAVAVMAGKTREVASFIAAVNEVFTREVGPKISSVADGLAGLRKRLLS